MCYDDAGRPLRVLGTAVDVTDAKRDEEALRASEAQFRQLAEAMPQIVWTARPDGKIDYFNRKWYQLTGLPEGAVGDESWLPLLHPDDRQRGFDVWYESVRTGIPYQIEYRFRFAGESEYRWHLGRALPVRDRSGAVVRWCGTYTDIHDRMRAQADLVEADRRKNEFLAMLAHELRNPLGPIRNSVTTPTSLPTRGPCDRRNRAGTRTQADYSMHSRHRHRHGCRDSSPVIRAVYASRAEPGAQLRRPRPRAGIGQGLGRAPRGLLERP